MAEWLNRNEFPFRSRWWEASAGRLHFVDEGAGEPVVFVHGVPGWSYNFRAMIRRLSPTYRCVAVDHLGFGLSDKPENWSYEPAAIADDLEAVIDGLGLEKLTLVVHDWGGPLGLRYALHHPGNVARIVVMNSWMWSASGDPRARLAAWLLASPVYRSLEDRFAVTPRWFTRLAVGRRREISDDTFAHFEAPFRDRCDRAGLKALVRAIRGSDAWVGSLWEGRDRLHDIPALILWGMRDPAFPPRYLQRWETMFARCEVQRLDGVGHYPHEEVPAAVGDRLEQFLEEHRSRDAEHQGGE